MFHVILLLIIGFSAFIDQKTQMSDFFNKNEFISYNNIEDLNYKINFYKNNEKIRKKIAENGSVFGGLKIK